MSSKTCIKVVASEGLSDLEFGVQLLGKVYADVSAYVIDWGNGYYDIQLFDTYAAAAVLKRYWPSKGRVLLFSRHMHELPEPNEYDLRNMDWVPQAEMIIICGNKAYRANP